MHFQRKTSASRYNWMLKTVLVLVVVFLAFFLIDKIDFPSPIKKIEKVISNENFKIIK
tara:strand:+ start:7372 stop:7545 length:174 start_codon:yes stop_codon:yes gene_type:complete